MIKCLIVDDEPYAIKLIEKHVNAINDIEVVATCKNIAEAVNVLLSKNVDLMFLDVQMPEITGVEFLENMNVSPSVILTTAYREYAVQAYEFGVLDYLVKPISFMRFAKAIERYRQVNIDNNLTDEINLPIVIKSGTDYHRVVPADIVYIKSVREYVTIYCNDLQYLVRSSMNQMLSQLPDGAFVQVHKSYIVPVNSIITVTSTDVVLTDNNKIPLGKAFSDNVRRLFSR